VSRRKNTTATAHFGNRIVDIANGTSDKAVDGNYNNTELDQCATLFYPYATRSTPGWVRWEVDLGGLYAIVSVTIYNTAVLPGTHFIFYPLSYTACLLAYSVHWRLCDDALFATDIDTDSNIVSRKNKTSNF